MQDNLPNLPKEPFSLESALVADGWGEPIAKKYYSISEVSDMLQINASVLRFWEKEFRELEPRKTKGGHRLYSEADVELLRKIHYLVKVRKFTLQGAREKLKANPKDVESTLRTREALQNVRTFLVNLRDALPPEEPQD